MGREIKRVPLDFDAPLGVAWAGHENPHHKECSLCGGEGATASRRALERILSTLMLAGADSMEEPRQGRTHPHPFVQGAGVHDVGDILHEVTTGLAGRPPDALFGHDSTDKWRAERKILAAAGLPEGWGYCKTCGGEGVDPAVQEAYEAWEPGEVPEGEGWQLWQTVSDGPISPVFATAEELVDFMCEPAPFGRAGRQPWARGYDRKTAEAFVRVGWAPSFVSVGGRMMTGVEAVAEEQRREEGGD